MKSMDIICGLNGIQDPYIVAAGEFRQRKVRLRGVPKKRTLLIAAIIAVLLMLTACAAVVYLSLKDMKFDEDVWSGEVERNGVVETRKVPRDILGLYGSPDSAIQKAGREWYDYENSYDWHLRENHPDLPVPYALIYSCGNREMADKLDEIAAKYDLKLLQGRSVVTENQMELALEAGSFSGVFKSNTPVDCQRYPIALFAPGNLRTEFSFSRTGDDTLWKDEVIFTEYLFRKDYMPTEVRYLVTQEGRDEWSYTEPGGTQLLLELDPYGGGLIVADMADATITISIDFSRDYNNPEPEVFPTRAVLEQFAELFDYSVRPNLTDPEGLNARIQEAEEAEIAKIAASWPVYSNYAELFEERAANLRRYNFCFYDLNGDGSEEVLLSEDRANVSWAYSLLDGKATEVFTGGSFALLENGGFARGTAYYMPAQLGKFLYFEYMPQLNMAQAYSFEETKLDEIEFWDGQWYRRIDVDNKIPISDEEAQAVKDRYPLKQLDWKPMRQFPLDGSRTLQDVLNALDVPISETELRKQYAEEIQRRADYSDNIYYCLTDINRDGIQECLISDPIDQQEDYFSGVLTYCYGRVERFWLNEDVYLCEDGVLEGVNHYPFAYMTEQAQIHRYFRFDEDGRDIELVRIIHHLNSSTWTTDLYGRKSISAEQAQAIMAKYPRIAPPMRPIAELME